MDYLFSKSCRGFAHLRNGKPCQDDSLCYQDKQRVILTCCDGHGGDLYVRSDRGSRFASEALFRVYRDLTPNFLAKYKGKEAEEKTKMEILCEWGRLVGEDIAHHSFTKKELEPLDEHQREILLANPIKAYGSTMAGAMVLDGKLVLAGIGDTECLLLRQGTLVRPLEDEDDPAGNITYSLCQDDAYAYIRVKVLNLRGYDGVLLCTDGFSGPFQSYANLLDSFVKPLMKKTILGQSIAYVNDFVSELAASRGSGDDVSLSFFLKGDANIRKYR